jgi:hypothetical protein
VPPHRESVANGNITVARRSIERDPELVSPARFSGVGRGHATCSLRNPMGRTTPRARWTWTLSPIVVASAVACTMQAQPQPMPMQMIAPQPTPQENASDASAAPYAATVTDTSCLGQAGLAFPKAACNACMNVDDCCHKTIACIGDPECVALQGCLVKCDGLGGDGGSALGSTPSVGPAEADFVANVYPSLVATCGSCHASGGVAPRLYGADGYATYAIFKALGFDQANSLLLSKSQHEGPPLTAPQVSLIRYWVSLESAGGGIDAGGDIDASGGIDGGAEAGGGAGAIDAASCKTACKAQHPKGLTAWQPFEQCVAGTCGSACL